MDALRLIFALAVLGTLCGLSCAAPGAYSSISNGASFPATRNLSYAELADTTVPDAIAALRTAVPAGLSNETQPWGVHTFREQLLAARDLLDIFVYVYPTPTVDGAPDVWALLRGDLNVGYTEVGNYQNLNHSALNYTAAERQVLLNECLTWQATYVKHDLEYDYVGYAGMPSFDRLFTRPDSDYSRFFWEWAHASPSSASENGLGVVADLQNALLGELVTNFTRAAELTNITSTANHTTFHYYRKLTRAANALTTFFPHMYKQGANDSTAFINAFNASVTSYNEQGNINDVVTAAEWYTQHGNPWAAAERAEIATAMWANLTMWWGEVDLPLQFDTLAALLNRNHSALEPPPQRKRRGTSGR